MEFVSLYVLFVIVATVVAIAGSVYILKLSFRFNIIAGVICSIVIAAMLRGLFQSVISLKGFDHG